MNYKSLFITILVFVFGCVSMPKPIDETYLSDKTNEEALKLEKLETDIIAKNKSKEKVEKDLEIASQKLEVSRKAIDEIGAAGALLLEKEKLYNLTGDNQRLAENQKQKEIIKVKEIQTKAYFEYCKIKKEEVSVLLKVRQAELGVDVAELDYEKALIVKKYQMKRGDEFKEKQIDETEYKKFLENQNKILENNRKKHEQALKAVSEEEIKLKKTGYEGEL